jgi:hypothetical protein
LAWLRGRNLGCSDSENYEDPSAGRENRLRFSRADVDVLDEINAAASKVSIQGERLPESNSANVLPLRCNLIRCNLNGGGEEQTTMRIHAGLAI